MRILPDKIRPTVFCKAHRISSSRTPHFRIVVQNKSEEFSCEVKRERKIKPLALLKPEKLSLGVMKDEEIQIFSIFFLS